MLLIDTNVEVIRMKNNIKVTFSHKSFLINNMKSFRTEIQDKKIEFSFDGSILELNVCSENDYEELRTFCLELDCMMFLYLGSFPTIESIFYNGELRDIDITKGNLDEVGSSLKDVVDKAIEIGVVSDDSAESVAKVVDILTDMGLTGSVSIDNLTKSFTEAQDSINKTTSNMESLKSILSESVSGAGMSADSVKAFKDMFGNDADKALEKTANGYHLNQKALAQLQEQQKQSTKTDYLGSLADQQEALRKVEESISKGSKLH